MIPVQLSVRDLEKTASMEYHVNKCVNKLAHYCQQINQCHIAIDIRQKHSHQGKHYEVRASLMVPGKNLLVANKTNENIYVAIYCVFNALERMLEKSARQKRLDRHSYHERLSIEMTP